MKDIQGKKPVKAVLPHSDNPCVCFNLRKASRVITQIYDEAMRPLGFRATQVTILLAVQKMQPVTVSTLAQRISTDRTTLTRNFKPLEKKGLIIIRFGQDRREREVIMTSNGDEILKKALPIWTKAQREVSQAVGKSRLNQLIRDLSEVLEDIRKI